MFKKRYLLLYTFIFIFLWNYFFPFTLEGKIFSAIKSKCKQKESCIISLHKIIPFKWDEAYFFEYNSDYNSKNYIQNITGIQGDFKQYRKTRVVFIYKGQLVKYVKFRVVDGYDYESPLFPSYFPLKSVNINFVIPKNQLKEFNYSDNFTKNYNSISDFIGINYYKIIPQNDKLRVNCALQTYNKLIVDQCNLSFTNLNQVNLFNP